MECRNCGKPLEDGLQVCPNCGTVAEELREMTGDSAWEGIPRTPGNRNLTMKEFFNHQVMRKHRDYLWIAAIGIYFIAFSNLFMDAFAVVDLAGILSDLIVLGLGLGMHLGKSRVCAVLLTISAVLSIGSAISVWLTMICIIGTVQTFEMKAAWNTYQQKGDYPGIW